MRARFFIESEYYEDLRSEIITLLAAVSAEGVNEIDTQNLLSDLEAQGFSVDEKNLMEILDELDIVSTATGDSIAIATSDADMMVGRDAKEIEKDRVDNLATSQATKDIGESSDREDFFPISEYPRDDDSDDTLLLRTKNGAIYRGSWDGDSGYFFAAELVDAPDGADLLDEIPGRMYQQPIEFAYTDEIEEQTQERKIWTESVSRLRTLAGIKRI